MRILAIETSCDDTCVSILEASDKTRPSFTILSNVVSSQVEIHRPWGGVYPTLAKREHQKNLVPVLKRALGEAGMLEKNQPRTTKGFGVALHPLVVQGKFQNFKKILEREPELYTNLVKFFKKYTIDIVRDRERSRSLQKKDKFPIDAIAVTVGPGLEPCLWQGVNFVRALSYLWKIPIIPINHLEAHIFANFIGSNFQFSRPKRGSPKAAIFNFQNISPALCLIVSGGHTQLILMNPVRKSSISNGVKSFGKYKLIGETRDDAAGECLDKVAKILGLGYPGGPVIAAMAAKEVRSTKYEDKKVRSTKYEVRRNEEFSELQTSDFRLHLPRPMMYTKDYDFSFSGLKTAVLYKVRSMKYEETKKKKFIQVMCAEVQQAVIDVLISKTLRAAKEYKVKTIILGGGVVANKELRRQFSEKIKKELPGTRYLVPSIKFCTDNAAMAAVSAYFNQNKKTSWRKIKAEANLRIG